MVESLEANSNNISKPIAPSLYFSCDGDSICMNGEVCGSHRERACSSCTMQLGCRPLPASEPSPPPNMAEDPLRHTTRDGLSYNNYDGAGKLTFLIFSLRLTMLGSSHDYDARFSDPRQASVGLPLRQAFRQPQGEPKMHDITEKFKRACDGRITLSFSFKKNLCVRDFPTSQLFTCSINYQTSFLPLEGCC
jgi:hypothetical protein